MSKREYQNDKKAKLEAMRVKKLSAEAVISQQENRSGAAQAETNMPMSFKNKWGNYWYHYKYITIGMAFVVVCVVSILFSIFANKKFDITIAIASETSFDGGDTVMEENLLQFVKDYDGNGKPEVNIQTFQLEGTESANISSQMLYMNHAKLLGTVADGETFIYMLDEEAYRQLKEVDVQFLDLQKLTDSQRVEGDKYLLNGANLNQKLGLNAVLDDMFICIIDFDKFNQNSRKNEKILREYEKSKSFFLDIVVMD